MEHEGFSFTTLRTSLQVLLNRKRIAEKGNLQPDVVPLVRIPPNARERDQWIIKQALDTGVYGLVLAPPEHGGGRSSRRRRGTLSPGAGRARLRTGGGARLGQSHRLTILGPNAARILRRSRPVAAG